MRVPTGSSDIFQVKCAYRDLLGILAHGEFKWKRKPRSRVGKLRGIPGSKRRWKWISPGSLLTLVFHVLFRKVCQSATTHTRA